MPPRPPPAPALRNCSSFVDIMSTTWILGYRCLIATSVSNPPSSGMRSSRNTISNLPSPICFSAAIPFSDSSISRTNLVAARTLRTIPRRAAESSTMRTLVGIRSRMQRSIMTFAFSMLSGLTTTPSGTTPPALNELACNASAAMRITKGRGCADRADAMNDVRSAGAAAASRSATSTSLVASTFRRSSDVLGNGDVYRDRSCISGLLEEIEIPRPS